MSSALGLTPSLSTEHPFPFVRHANSAGAPLPRIPRRTSSSSSSSSTGTASRSYHAAQAAATLQSIFASEHAATSASSPASTTASLLASPPASPSPSHPHPSPFPSPSKSRPKPKSTLPVPPAALVIEPPTPPPATQGFPPASASTSALASGSGSGSSSSGAHDPPIQIAQRTHRGAHRPKAHLLRPPEESTPTPCVFRAKAKAKAEAERVAWPAREAEGEGEMLTPRPPLSGVGARRNVKLKVNTSGLSAPASTSNTNTNTNMSTNASTNTNTNMIPTRAVSVPRSVEAALVRKKSGEPLKSSLKARRARARGDITVVTEPSAAAAAAAGAGTSKSEPSTPTCGKSVHFDAQLEHVRLFLAGQKPLAVSRAGSPTADTSGTDSEWLSDGTGTRRPLAMEVVNMPRRTGKATRGEGKGKEEEKDVELEELVLSPEGTSVAGRVRVRNLAFEKWVAVRFTFDWWQTTSEVTARYAASSADGAHDVFAFSIRLNDMLARIEEKTLFMAVRYTVAGREVWDNNGGENYQVRFTRAAPQPQTQTSPQVQAGAESDTDAGIADLRSKLERVAIGRETVGGYIAQHARRPSASPSLSPSPYTEQFDLRSNTPLSSRYDFSASLKSPWKGLPASPVLHERNSTYPNALPHLPPRALASTPDKTAIAEDPTFVTRGSPRILDADDDARLAPFYAGSDPDDTPAPALSRRRSRNHQRGYFDLGIAHSAGVRKTPPAFRRDASLRHGAPEAFRVSSFPNPGSSSGRQDRLSPPWLVERGGSEESTPSITSTSESSRSPSPIDGPAFSFVESRPGRSQLCSPVGDSNYHVFLSKFCFYTGSDSLLDVQPDMIQRSHSASSVEEFLSSPVLNYHLSPGATPTRSSSFDDVARMNTSGSSTPTARSLVESESATPVRVAH
ncbi:hypothetical protein AcV7_009331 [Taiwanofungus camphoratus]|nr:hypothetical protein AcV7_009331 [Antrodia cinnamomea]